MKNKFWIILSMVICVTLCGCAKTPTNNIQEHNNVEYKEEQVKIPDVTDAEEEVAKNVLSSNGLIPIVRYEYDDLVEEGNVIRVEPNVGEMTDKNSKITVYVSKGASYVEAVDSTISWYNIGAGQDEWEFYNPYISDGILYIECSVIFSETISWKGDGFGNASVNDTFDKTVPVSIDFKKKTMKAGKEYAFTLEIPISDLDVSRPTNMYIELVAMQGEEVDIKVNFSMTW